MTENKEKIKSNEDSLNQKNPKDIKINSTSDYDSSSYLDLRTNRGQILFFIITISVPLLFKFIMPDLEKYMVMTNVTECSANSDRIHPEIKKPIYWVYGKNLDGGHLVHVHAVLKRLGFEQKTNESNWDLLWAHDYPFGNLQKQMLNLQSHQKVNHFPGCGFITNKVDLATTKLKYIPRSFRLPSEEKEFLDYSKKYPNVQYVQKHNQHRHISIKSPNEVDLSKKDTFIQVYVDNPLLVDGHKFDIGVYTIITSINPLRVYIYKGDILFRFCPVKYYPFDPKNIDKYIVGDDYLPIWEVPSLSEYYNAMGFGMKASFDAYMKNKNRNTDQLWEQVEDAIRILILNKEKSIANILSQKYKNQKNFFELMRFDLVFDDEMNAHLMEANMSPNLSSAHFPPNQLLYEQVLYNALGLLGIGTLIHRESFRTQTHKTEIMISSDKSVFIDPISCTNLCADNCESDKCNLCKHCISASDLQDLHSAYREHVRRGETKRIFPKPINDRSIDVTLSEEYQQLTPKNKLITRWFYEKCKTDITWCH